MLATNIILTDNERIMPVFEELEARDFSHLYPRDFRSQVTPNATQRTTLIVAGVYIIAIAVLWYEDPLNFNAVIDFMASKACSILEFHQ